ncbi:hypothetical protein K435DRAFT_965531 [Dendrothele bispora CBS 962.96]|uniref:Uncharacterized protein n=1 Tax=Dendrothele bispora (strain CBS 962.96) TaxID=1314807 RepID=A0A4V4HG45_DENBC|nr:hypothetical protein K435DRAFT_965531 [Dendrothele bispora CBS 962.96]
MPVHRTKKRASSVDEIESKPKKPRASQKTPTKEQKEINVAKEKQEARKALRQAKKEWETSLEQWDQDEEFQWPTGTLAMYKSDARSSYSLTDTDLSSLPHESISNSPKAFYRYDDIKDLAAQKLEKGAMKEGYELPETKESSQIRLFKKTIQDERRNADKRVTANWSDLGFVYVRMIDAYASGAWESKRKKDSLKETKGEGSSSSSSKT